MIDHFSQTTVVDLNNIHIQFLTSYNCPGQRRRDCLCRHCQ